VTSAPSPRGAPPSGVEILDRLEDTQHLREDWARLCDHPEQSWGLYRNSVENRAGVIGPVVIAAHGEDGVDAILAGWIEESAVELQVGYWKALRLPVKRILFPMRSLLGEADEETVRGLVGAVVEELSQGRADVALFQFMVEGSTLHSAVKELPLGFRMRDRVPERRIHRFVLLPSTFEEYHGAHKGLMQKVRKFERTFRDRFEYRLLTRPEEVDFFCEGADAVVRDSYHRAMGVGFLNDAENRGRLASASRQGVWRAFVALVDDRMVAFWSGYQADSTVSLWWTGYDGSLGKYSPGLVTSARMVERLISEGVDVLDFGGGDAIYKERLGTRSRWEESICVFSPNVRGTLSNGLRTVDASIKNLVRNTRLKGVANRVKTPWRRFLARRHARRRAGSDGRSGTPS
jgi:hypothetical protein